MAMAQGLRAVGVQRFRCSRLGVRVRCEAAPSVSVKFAVQKHTNFGQSIIVVGGHEALGNWDPAHGIDCAWHEGDNWQGDAKLSAGTAVEYKYVVKGKNGLEWGPGGNKTVTVPVAFEVQVKDSWDGAGAEVDILKAEEQAAVASKQSSTAAPVSNAAAVAAPSAPAATVVARQPAEVSAAVDHPHFAVAELPHNNNGLGAAVNTLENIEVEELLPTKASALEGLYSAGTAAGLTHGGGLGLSGVSNNVVSAPPGISSAAASSQDDIVKHEEADNVKITEVHAGTPTTILNTATASAGAASAVAERKFDKMSVSELKSECKKRGMSSFGTRRELVTRLEKMGA